MPGYLAQLVFAGLIFCVWPQIGLALTAQERAVGDCVARAMALEGAWHALAAGGVSGAEEAAEAAQLRAELMLRRAQLSHVGTGSSTVWQQHLSVSLSGAMLRLRMAMETHPRTTRALELEARRLRRECAMLDP